MTMHETISFYINWTKTAENKAKKIMYSETVFLLQQTSNKRISFEKTVHNHRTTKYAVYRNIVKYPQINQNQAWNI